MSPAPSSAGLRSQRPRVRSRAATPSYPALLCLAIASAATACSAEPWPEEPADAQADAVADMSDAELSSDAGAEAPVEDEMQVAGCSATMYGAGPPGSTLPGALAIVGVIAAGIRFRRRR